MTQKKNNVSISSLIIALVVFSATAYVFVNSIQAFGRTYIEDDWKVAPGVILDPKLKLDGKMNQQRHMQGLEQTINYEYVVDGQTYRSNSTSKEAYVLPDNYPQGKKVDVYYNPRKLSESVLVRSPLQKPYLFVVMLLCIVIAGFVVWSVIRSFKRV